MIIRATLLASLVFLSAAVASAQATYTTSITVQSGNPLSALAVNDIITVDISLRTDGTAILGLGASASGYDGILSFTSGTASTGVLYSDCIPPPSNVCFGQAQNLVGGPLVQTTFTAGQQVQFVTVALGASTTNTGAIDPGIDNSPASSGDPQFQIIFQAIAEGSFDLVVGSLSEEFGNATILPSGAEGITINSVVPITVPEPAAIASSLAALGSVFAVVGIRRRAA